MYPDSCNSQRHRHILSCILDHPCRLLLEPIVGLLNCFCIFSPRFMYLYVCILVVTFLPWSLTASWPSGPTITPHRLTNQLYSAAHRLYKLAHTNCANHGASCTQTNNTKHTAPHTYNFLYCTIRAGFIPYTLLHSLRVNTLTLEGLYRQALFLQRVTWQDWPVHR